MNIGQVYHIASIVCYVLSALSFILVVYLFFRYRIVNAFNVLSGRKLKQDMERLSHLSGSASESGGSAEPVSQAGKKKIAWKKSVPTETETLFGTGPAGDTESADTVYDTEYDDGSAEPSDTDELDIVVTNATDTELL